MSKNKNQVNFQHIKWQRKVLYAPEFKEKHQANAPLSYHFDNFSSAEPHSAVPLNLRHVIYHACAVSEHVNCTMLYAATLLAYAEADDSSDWLKFYCSNPQALFLGNALGLTLILCVCDRIYNKTRQNVDTNMVSNDGGDFMKHRQAKNYMGGMKSIVWEFLVTFRSFAIFTAFNFALSPILASLTQSVSTDSIYFLASSSFIVNAFLQNYQAPPPRPPRPSRFTMDVGDYRPSKVRTENDHNLATSLKISTSRLRPPAFNSALFGSICLASRLPPSPYHAFTATSLSALVFGLWPDMRARLRSDRGNSAHTSLPLTRQELYTIFLTALTCLSLYTMPNVYWAASETLNLIFAGFESRLTLTLSALFLNIIITLAIPALFVRMQVYKNVIRGPWDEAVIPPMQ